VCLAPSGASAQGTAQTDQDLINPDRPGIADGSKVIAPGALQVEFGVERDNFSDTHVISVPLLVRVGVARRLEARVEGNTFTRASSRRATPTRTSNGTETTWVSPKLSRSTPNST